jgi:hypothetical protein
MQGPNDSRRLKIMVVKELVANTYIILEIQAFALLKSVK